MFQAAAFSAAGQQQQQPGGSQHGPRHRGGLLSRLFKGKSTRHSDSRRGRAAVTSNTPSRGPAWACAPAGDAARCVATAAVATRDAPAVGAAPSAPVLGFPTNLEEKYAFTGKELGKGGNGLVRVVADKATGTEYACKSMPKVLAPGPGISDRKRADHLDALRREIDALSRLAGSLNVVALQGVYEDGTHVHLVMEWCRGGELWHRVGDRHYSERTVASYMRAALRTLAQCHAAHLLHRDIKPGNFMLLTEDERSPLKAIDFGLAAPFDPQALPRTDLGLEGTPWYMAPETLRGEWLPASDVWSAGVMAHQLLCGRFPFDDRKNAYAPAITAVWRSVLNDPLDFSKSWWADISDEAKDFVRALLSRDPAARPTAKEALKHPWLRGNSSERSTGKQISQGVVARIQRFAAGSAFKRTVLQSIAAELLSHPQLLGSAGSIGSLASMDAAPATASRDGSSSSGSSAGAASAGSGAASSRDSRDGERCSLGPNGRPIIPTPTSSCLRPLLAQLKLDGAAAGEEGPTLDEQTLEEVLGRMGLRLAPGEAARLMAAVDLGREGAVGAADFAASQVDWKVLQTRHAELWLDLAARAFHSLDTDGSGVLEADELVAALRARLPEEEVAAALERALEEAAGRGGGLGGGMAGGGSAAGAAQQGIDFEAFVNLLKVGSLDSLDLYDDRSGRSGSGAGGSVGGSLASAATRSLSSLRSGDWSRHAAAGAAQDGSSHHAGAAASDASTDGAEAHPGTVFRFDLDKTSGAKGAGAGGGAAPSPPPTGAGMVWRFDVGVPPPPPAPPAPAPAWRFDVSGGNAWAAAQGAQHKAEAQGVTPSQTQAHSSAEADTQAVGAAIRSLGRQGGFFDRRHHGGNLYTNVALKALQAATGQRLDTVAE